MNNELWVSPGVPRAFRVISGGLLELCHDGSVVTADRRQFRPLQVGYYDLESEDSGLGKKRKSLFKKHIRVMQKVRRKIEPKPIRKVFSKKNFVKYAPVLAAVAQVLNIIPGLGVAVGLAILAGSAAVAAGVAVVKLNEAKKQKAKQKAAEKNANVQADAAFAQGEQYFTEKYNMPKATFQQLPLEEKLNFLQNAVEDANKESKPGAVAMSTAGNVGWGLTAAGLLALMFI